MATLHVHLQDGFVGEPVVVRVGSRVILDVPDARTKPQTGLAKKAKPVDVPAGRQVLTVRLPSRSADACTLDVNVSDPETYVGLSVDESGTVTHREWTERRAYL
jgi:hypothetical protein